MSQALNSQRKMTSRVSASFLSRALAVEQDSEAVNLPYKRRLRTLSHEYVGSDIDASYKNLRQPPGRLASQRMSYIGLVGMCVKCRSR